MAAYDARRKLSPEERERLILEHLPQVRLIARRIHERLPKSVSLDDLISTGIVGLISAIDNYDPRMNVKLKTYAEYKIRGAILDSLRGLDWAPRQHRRRVKQIEAAIAAAEQKLQRVPTEEEIAEELGVSLQTYHEWLAEDVREITLGTVRPSNDEQGRELWEYLADTEETSPAWLVEQAELRRLVAEAIERIPPNERLVLALYYQEGLTLREIAQVVQLHESRISQLKSQAILRVRSYIQRHWPMDTPKRTHSGVHRGLRQRS